MFGTREKGFNKGEQLTKSLDTKHPCTTEVEGHSDNDTQQKT